MTNAEPSSTGAGRWHRPRSYFTILALYFLVIGAILTSYVSNWLFYESHKVSASGNDFSGMFGLPALVFIPILGVAAALLLKTRPSIYFSILPLSVMTAFVSYYFSSIANAAMEGNYFPMQCSFFAVFVSLCVVIIGMDLLWLMGFRQRKIKNTKTMS